MYQHSILRVNYTTYDVRRAQDTINPRTDHRDILLLSQIKCGRNNVTTHQFQYARVLGIYHVNLIYNEPTTHQYQTHRMDFLWVRYFEVIQNVSVQRGWSTSLLDQLQFHPLNSANAFGFVDPAQVLRGCHIIPRFSMGKWSRDNIVAVSVRANSVQDWVRYYANRSVKSILGHMLL
jgi:hypothetical protein